MNDITVGIGSVGHGDRQQTWSGRVRRLLRRGRDALAAACMRRRQRLALARLDARLLRDIGISREQARAEAEKPFWRS